MSKSKISPVLAPVIDGLLSPPKPREIVLPHKKRTKSGITHRQPKPGKNKPAKGYNPETKEWDKQLKSLTISKTCDIIKRKRREYNGKTN